MHDLTGTDRNNTLAYMVIVSGLLTIIFGVTVALSAPLYILRVTGEKYLVYEKDFAILTVLAGIALVRYSFRLRFRRTRGWRITFSLLLLVTVIYALYGITLYIPTAFGLVFNLVVLFMLYRHRNEFKYPSARLLNAETVAAVITITFTLSYGIGGSLILGDQFSPEIHNLGQAVYYTGEVVTTLGFGDILPVTLLARLFTISLVVLGIASFFGAMVILVSPMIERRIGGIVDVLKRHQLETIKNYTLVCGYSSYLLKYLDELRAAGEIIVVMGKEGGQSEALKNSGYLMLDESPEDESVLKTFDFNNVNRIFIASPDDSYNLIVAASFYQLENQDVLRKKIAVIVNSPSNNAKFRIFGYSIVDLSSVVSSYLKQIGGVRQD
ncbi:MAG: ion channel [Thermoplasmata archaeon]